MKKITIIILVLFLIGISFGILTLYDFLLTTAYNAVPKQILRGWYSPAEYQEYLMEMQERTYFIITFSFLISGSVLLFVKNKSRLF